MPTIAWWRCSLSALSAGAQRTRSSDLDLVVALVDQAAVEDVRADWETLIEKITPTVYRRLLGTQIVTVVTPSWERLDITFMPVAATGLLTSGPATVLFDHGQTQPPVSPAAACRVG